MIRKYIPNHIHMNHIDKLATKQCGQDYCVLHCNSFRTGSLTLLVRLGSCDTLLGVNHSL